ncbi:plasmid recombination protein [Christensenella sp. MSJ-20]|uniref:plasmid recombination protein n=1 Tax=Christensenella sp. MSJ-20 TaxID=2841518 RepID=UPI0037C101EE
MAEGNWSVVRVEKISAEGAQKTERHNERKNESYANLNVDTEQIARNIHFKDTGGLTYNEYFQRLIDEGKISTRGQKAGATIFNELVIDVNTRYFEEHGGYEYPRDIRDVFYLENGNKAFLRNPPLHIPPFPKLLFARNIHSQSVKDRFAGSHYPQYQRDNVAAGPAPLRICADPSPIWIEYPVASPSPLRCDPASPMAGANPSAHWWFPAQWTPVPRSVLGVF